MSLPPYSIDLAPTDFHFFRSASNGMQGILFSIDVELRAWLDEFFESKPGDFYQRGIENLMEEIVRSKGDYIID